MDDWEAESVARDVADAVETLGYECVHVGLKTDSARPRLQVLIDSIGGIGLDDCEIVSKSLNRMLDERDFSGGSEKGYYLEVSSPGLERPLFTLPHYRRFVGREARLHLSDPIAGRKTLTGRLAAADEDGVTLLITGDTGEEEAVLVPLSAIKSGNLIFRDLSPEENRKPRGQRGRSPEGQGQKMRRGHGKRHEEEL